jgi:hypothetical protein
MFQPRLLGRRERAPGARVGPVETEFMTDRPRYTVQFFFSPLPPQFHHGDELPLTATLQLQKFAVEAGRGHALASRRVNT